MPYADGFPRRPEPPWLSFECKQLEAGWPLCKETALSTESGSLNQESKLVESSRVTSVSNWVMTACTVSGVDRSTPALASCFIG